MYLPEGLSVLVPERGRADLLAITLLHLRIAREELDAQCEALVLVNGSCATDYAGLQDQYPDVDFLFEAKPLGYGAAIEQMVRHARFAWVYLLNSDMSLNPDALAHVWRWRGERVFAVASQIFFADPTRRREETGWCVPAINKTAQVELHDRLPIPDDQVRGTLYAGGGSSLMQKALLQRFMKNTSAYAPFYFEDADWGMQAWASGFDVLFCPQSIGVHFHRGTISRYYKAAQIDAIVQRNLRLWRLRYGDRFHRSSFRRTVFDRTVSALNWLRPSTKRVRKLLQLNSTTAPDWPSIPDKLYFHAPPWRDGKIRALVVSPFSVLPPTHGGARRVLELCRSTAHAVDWILLTDEGPCVGPIATDHTSMFRQWHSVRGRPADGDSAITRLDAHAHAAFKAELRRVLTHCNVQLVCLEHYESLGLLDAIPTGIPVVVTLHDGGANLPPPVRQWIGHHLKRVRAVVVPSVLDHSEFTQQCGHVVPNGVAIQPAPGPSPLEGVLLLVAPLRYEANQRAVRDFMRECWPRISNAAPGLRLRFLAGEDGHQRCQELGLPRDDAIEVVAEFSDPLAHYQACCMAINPQTRIEGSSLKLLEALGHGRMVISTRDGARGFELLNTPALVRVAQVSDMVDPILQYWSDWDARQRAEQLGPMAVNAWRWEAIGAQWLQVLTSCVQ
jgi:GT2 family glycosyltransferase